MVGLAAAMLIGLVAIAPVPAVASTGDPLGCEQAVFDPDGVLGAEVERAARTTGASLGADVHVRVERSVDGQLADRMAQLEAQCDGWSVDGERAPDLVVVMYTTLEREASIFYGADQGPGLEPVWESAIDAMIERFRDGDETGGVLDGLTVLRTGEVDVAAGGGTDRDDADDDVGGRGGGVPPGVVLAGVAVAGLVVYQLAVKGRAGGDLTDDDDGAGDGSGGRWRSSSRRRAVGFGALASSRRRSSSRSSSSRRSSRRSGSRRSGGGSKRW
jgi:hypothetical protein